MCAAGSERIVGDSDRGDVSRLDRDPQAGIAAPNFRISPHPDEKFGTAQPVKRVFAPERPHP